MRGLRYQVASYRAAARSVGPDGKSPRSETARPAAAIKPGEWQVDEQRITRLGVVQDLTTCTTHNQEEAQG